MNRRHVQIQTTEACPAACLYCPHKDSQRAQGRRMSDVTFNGVLDALKGMPIGKLCLYLQADPFADPSIAYRMRRAIEVLQPNEVEMSTNARLADPDRAGGLLEIMRLCGKASVWVTFLGSTPAEHQRLMGLPWEPTFTNAKALLHMADNLRMSTKIVAAGAGAHALWAPTMDAMQRPPKFTRLIRPKSRAQNVVALKTQTPRGKNWRACARVKKWLTINWRGQVIVCCDDYHEEVVYGSLLTDGLPAVLRAIEPMMAQLEAELGTEFLCARCDERC